ncbi:MAG: 50S ribosomal protein L4 [Moorellales bacterium]
MISVAVLNHSGQAVGEMPLREDIFGLNPREHTATVHRAVERILADRRRGTASTKRRGEVAGGGRKPWRQKGTGRARAGSIRSPLWRGGGVVFGPKPRDYSFALPRKLRRLALRAALSAKLSQGKLIVVDSLALGASKTKEALAFLRAVNAWPKALVVTEQPDPVLRRALRNLPGAKLTTVESLNPYDLLAHEKVVLSRQAVARLEEVLG